MHVIKRGTVANFNTSIIKEADANPVTGFGTVVGGGSLEMYLRCSKY